MGDKITFGNVTGSTVAAGRGAQATSTGIDDAQAVAELQRALLALDRKIEQEPETAQADVVLATSAALRAALAESQVIAAGTNASASASGGPGVAP